MKIPPMDLLATVSPALLTDYQSNKVGLSAVIFSGTAAAGALLGALPTVSGSRRALLLALSAGTGCAATAQHERGAVRQAGALG